MTQHERDERRESLWQIDETLGELELQEPAGGPDLYTVRLKTRTERAPYRALNELYPLAHNGTRQDIFGKAYILVPDMTLTVGLAPQEEPSGAIGQVTASSWQGMRHHEIAALRGLYYEEDAALAIWEVDGFGRLDSFAHGTLWRQFESFLARRFPQATRVYSDDSEPGEDPDQNQDFLTALGYQPVTGFPRIVVKEVGAA
ncbi:MAG: hypothetical protein NVSMB27_05570 [Ktedonobacteraceae bacterium]